jgi:hypothetical protein
MKTSITLISIFSLACFCGAAFGQTNNKPADANKTPAVKAPAKKTAAPAVSTALAKIQTQKTLPAGKAGTSNQPDKKVDRSSFSANMTFEQAISKLRHSTKPATRIVVMWRQMEKAGIKPTTPVEFNVNSKTTMKATLTALVQSASISASSDVDLSAPLPTDVADFWVKDGMIIIGSRQAKQAEKTTKIHNVCDLTSAPSNAVALGANFGQAGNFGYGTNAMAGGYGNSYSSGSYTPTMGVTTGASLGVGGYGAGGYGGNMNMGFGGGMGFNSPIETLQQQQLRQQELKTLIRASIAPGTWN